MAERLLAVRSRLLFIGTAANTYNIVVCLLSHDFTSTQNVIDTTSFCGESSLPGSLTSSSSFTGQSMLEPDLGRVSEYAIGGLHKNTTRIYWKIQETTPTSGSVTYTGRGYITSFSLGNPADNVPTFGGTITTDGAYTIALTP